MKILHLVSFTITLSLMLTGTYLGAQLSIVGTVLDEGSNEPLIGATIVKENSIVGAITDINGQYSIEASTGDVLIFSFTGMAEQRITVGTQTTIDVILSATNLLEEVIVVGYGSRKKGAISGSVALVDKAKLEQIPVASFQGALQGNVAGLQATNIDGTPGGNTQVRIRGIGSITASSEPLYVVDGLIVDSGSALEINGNGDRSGNLMAGLNPNDIESVSILKDAASTAIYGSRGANGVILITTKTGQTGKPKISLKTQFGFNSAAINKGLQSLNADQYTQLFLEGYTNGGETLEQAQSRFDSRFTQLEDPVTGQRTNTNWLDAITRTGFNHNYDFSVSGGTEDAKYYFSAGYFDQESHIIGSDFKRLSARMNLEVKPSDFLTISNKMTVSNTDQNGFTDGSAWANPLYNAFLLSPLIPTTNVNGTFNGEHQNYFPMGGNNPVGKLGGDDTRLTTQLRLLNSFSASFHLMDNLTFKSQWNVDAIQIDESEYNNPHYGNGRNNGGFAEEATSLTKNWSGTQSLNYTTEFGKDHGLGALVAYEAQKNTRKSTYGFGESFPNDKLRTLSSTAAAFEVDGDLTGFSFASILSRVNYVFKGKYFLDATYRRDGSSRFGSENRWGNFYSVGAAWAVSDEAFLADVAALDFLKLRTSYGTTGNASIGNFPSRGLYSYGQDYDGQPGGAPSQIANPALTWETQENFNIGVDFNIFKRVGGTIEYFNRISSDLILDVPISRTTGFTDLTQNFGEMKNSGWEFTINATLINAKDFSLDLGFNTTIISNKLTKLTEAFTDGTKRREEGRDYQQYYLLNWAGVNQTNGDPLWYTGETGSETTSNVNDAERVFLDKSATPDHFGGMNIGLTYKGFSLSSNFSYSAGNYIYDNQGRFIHGDGRLTPRSTSVYGFENRWVPGKTDALLPLHEWGDTKGGQTSNSSRYLLDGTFVRLRNLTASYNVDQSLVSKLGLSSIRIYARGVNLWTFTKDRDLFLDPEVGINGVTNSLTPAIKSFTFGIDFGF